MTYDVRRLLSSPQHQPERVKTVPHVPFNRQIGPQWRELGGPDNQYSVP